MFAIALTFISGGKAHAATIDVAAGNDETTVNSNCSLSEAITNINNGDATSYPECDSNNADPFGTDDTINLPSGTITLTAPLTTATTSVVIQGQGMSQTTIDGDGQWRAFNFFASTAQSVEVRQLKVTAFSDTAIQTESVNAVIDQVDIDGAGSVFSTAANATARGIGISNRGDSPITASVTNTYIHDMDTDGTSNVFGLITATGDDGPGTSEDIDATIQNVTVAKLQGSGNVFGIVTGAGMYSNGAGAGAAHSTVSNVTVTGMYSTAGPAGGIVVPSLGLGSHNVSVSVTNATIGSIVGNSHSPLFGGASSVALLGLAGGFIDGQHYVMDISSTNLVTAGAELGCVMADVSAPVFGTNSTSDLSLVSHGGNLSSNNSCSSYFTKPTDQNNVSGLGASLSALADNGGYVPTMALKQGSPAIDAGVTVPGLTTDARLAVRPQGNAYDSGAYESPYTRTTETGESLAGTGQSITPVLIIALTLMAVASSALLTRKLNR